MSAALTAENLTVVFDVPGGEGLLALGPVSFTIETGQFVCIVGPSGCGKSTLIRVFAGLEQPTEGAAFIDDVSIIEPLPLMGMMFQNANLMPWRTVIDNIALPMELAGISKADRYETAISLLPLLGLEEFKNAFPSELSGGMAQRAALGRVLVQNPDVLLLDEPFGALDAMTREKISLDLLRMWSRDRQTVLMVTHDINEAVLLSDRVLVMSQRPGRIEADITVNLPRPRMLDQIYERDFVKIARQVRAAIDVA
jgi:NitT/TauT family transport system ATP-binding protein